MRYVIGRLAGAARPHDRGELAGLDDEREVVQRPLAPRRQLDDGAAPVLRQRRPRARGRAAPRSGSTRRAARPGRRSRWGRPSARREHLTACDRLLRECRPALKTNGMLIVSVPNIANISVRLLLLLGKFDYTERGILDKTHVRFFTRKTARAFLEQNGYSITEERCT